MVTLVVGNGFDLAHELPTQYKNFLDFLNLLKAAAEDIKFEKIDEKTFISKLNAEADGKINKKLVSIIISKVNEKGIKQVEWIKNIDENYWFSYLSTVLINNNEKGENWIDFENEIADVIKKIEEKRISATGSESKMYEDNDEYPKSIQKFLSYKNNFDNDFYKKFIKKLYKDLEELICWLNKYILLVEKINLDNITAPDIREIADKIDTVISFNYSDTFRKGYIDDNSYEKIRIDFVHGKANEKNANLVLGAEETLTDKDRINNDLLCVRFKKYFQRIIKKTGLEYQKFYEAEYKKIETDYLDRCKDKFKNDYNKKYIDYEKIKQGFVNNNVAYFFGHSLSPNDGDIISYIIENNNKVYFYYYKDDNFEEQVENLIKILGKQKVIEYSKSRFEFIKQKKSKGTKQE